MGFVHGYLARDQDFRELVATSSVITRVWSSTSAKSSVVDVFAVNSVVDPSVYRSPEVESFAVELFAFES